MKDLIDKVKEKLDIVDVLGKYLQISKKGRNFFALCPFHNDTNPSLSISQTKQIYKCFSCGAGGDVIKFISEYKKIPFVEALKQLGEQVGVKVNLSSKFVPKYTENEKKILNVLKDANNFFKNSLLTSDNKEGLKYLESRNIDLTIADQFNIGFAPASGLKIFLKKRSHDLSTIINAGLLNNKNNDFFQNRLVFAIHNKFGDIVGFSGRALNLEKENVKYINSPESSLFKKSEILYNYFYQKHFIDKEKSVYITEGFFDVISMVRAGFKNTVALMGTNFSKDHLSFLKGKEIIFFLDYDEPGKKATVKFIHNLIRYKIKSFVVNNPEEKDPDQLFKDLPEKKFKAIVKNKIESLEFVYQYYVSKLKEKTADTINKFIKSFSKYFWADENIEISIYSKKLAKLFDLEISDVRELIKKHANSNQYFIVEPVEPNKNTRKKEIIRKKRNYYYELILSMIKKPFLIKIYLEERKKRRIDFFDSSLSAIITYLTKNNGEIKLSETADKDLIKKLDIIKGWKKFADDEKNFKQLYSIAYEYSKKEWARKTREKIKKEKDEDKIESIEKLQRKEYKDEESIK